MQHSANEIPGYPNLRTAHNGVDWKDVSPALLKRLNKLAGDRGKTIVVFSGFRPHGSPYGFDNDPHQRHIAVDALIDGQPIGNVIPVSEFAKYGIRTGNQPDFYQGKPDPSHVDLVGFGAKQTSPTAAPSAPPPSAAPASATSIGAADLPNPYTQPPPVVGGVIEQDPLAPGSVQAGAANPRQIYENWQQIASMSDASTETLAYLRNAQLAANGG